MIRLTIPQPQGLQFVEWGTLVAEQLATYGVPAPVSEATWQEWAQQLLQEPQLGLAPFPVGYSSWTDWASQFRDAFA